MLAFLTGAHKFLQDVLTDARFKWFPRQASGEIVLIAIDAPSIERMGVWPWPRRHHADLITQLCRAGASEILFDVDFSSPSDPVSDQSFAVALEAAGGSVVLPAFKQRIAGRSASAVHITRPLPQFEQHAWSAIVNVATDGDGLVRRYPIGDTLDGQVLPSVGAVLARKREIKQETIAIDFGIRADSIPTVSYADVLHGDPAVMRSLKGKRVIVGATAIELGDRFSVPNGQIIAGPQLQVLAAETILQSRALAGTSAVITLAGLVALLLTMLLMWRRYSAGTRVAVLVATAVVIELCATLLQARYAIVLNTAIWQAAIAAYLAAIALDEIDFRRLLGGIAERRFQKIAMSLGDGLICTDQAGTITVWNRGAQSIFGYAAAQAIGQPFERFFAASEDGSNDGRASISGLAGEATQEGSPRVAELFGRRKNGDLFPVEACFSRWEGVDGLQYGAVVRDVTERRRKSERIRYLAEHDSLTGLANRHSLYAHLNACLTRAKAQSGTVGLLLLDLDKFKQINDNHGHAWGDQLLCQVAQRLTDLVEKDSLVARLSGDEFAVVVSGEDVAERTRRLAERITLVFRKVAFFIDDRDFRINCSIGVSSYPDYGATTDELFGNADLALYRAKAGGRGRYVCFERAIRDELEARSSMEADLACSIEKGELELHYQPQISLKDGTISGAEALIRWRHPVRGLVSPADFMPIVNSSAMSARIALWVLETACRQGKVWEDRGRGVRIGVNLSPSQIQAGDLVSTVRAVLNGTGLSPNLLELEVTENILIDDDASAIETFRQIQDLGVHVVFDDFGTGYASLTYLKKFALDGLKIDRSFVRGLRDDSSDDAIVSCTISLGRLLGLRIVAEGIEDIDTARLLARMGCDEGQGFFFDPPMPAAEFEERAFGSPRTFAGGAAKVA